MFERRQIQITRDPNKLQLLFNSSNNEDGWWNAFLQSRNGLGFWIERGTLPNNMQYSGSSSSSSSSYVPLPGDNSMNNTNTSCLQASFPPQNQQLPALEFGKNQNPPQLPPIATLTGEFHLVEVLDCKLISAAHKSRIQYEFKPDPVAPPNSMNQNQNDVIVLDDDTNETDLNAGAQNTNQQQQQIIVTAQQPTNSSQNIRKLPAKRTRLFLLSDGKNQIQAVEKTNLPNEMVIGTKLLLVNKPQQVNSMLSLRTDQVVIMWYPPEYQPGLAAEEDNPNQYGGGGGGGPSGGDNRRGGGVDDGGPPKKKPKGRAKKKT